MKTMLKTLTGAAVAGAMAVAMVVTAPAVRAQEKDIVDTAVAAGSFKTLATPPRVKRFSRSVRPAIRSAKPPRTRLART